MKKKTKQSEERQYRGKDQSVSDTYLRSRCSCPPLLSIRVLISLLFRVGSIQGAKREDGWNRGHLAWHGFQRLDRSPDAFHFVHHGNPRQIHCRFWISTSCSSNAFNTPKHADLCSFFPWVLCEAAEIEMEIRKG